MLQRQLKPKVETVRFGWGSVKKLTAPALPEVFREILSLRTGKPAKSSTVNQGVAEYRAQVEAQNAASKKQLSSAYYFDRGFAAVKGGQVNHEVIAELWPGVQLGGVALADALFPSSGMPLVAGSQASPILIRAGALEFGGEKPEVLASMIARGRVLISDLTRPIVLLTPDLMNRYLDKALLQRNREDLKGDDQAKLQEYVLSAFQADQKKPGNEASSQSQDTEIAGVEKRIGPNPTNAAGFSFKVGDFSSQAAATTKGQAKRYDAKVAELQSTVDSDQVEVDKLRASAQLVRDNMRKGGSWSTLDPSSPEFIAAEKKLADEKAQLQQVQNVRQSYLQRADDLDSKKLTYEQLQTQVAEQSSKVVRSINNDGLGPDRGNGSQFGKVIPDANNHLEVAQIGEYIANLKTQREEIDFYSSRGEYVAPGTLSNIKSTLDEGFIPGTSRGTRQGGPLP